MKETILILFVVLNLSTDAQETRRVGGEIDFTGVIKIVVDEYDQGAQKTFLDTGRELIAVSPAVNGSVNTRVSIRGRLDEDGVIVPSDIRALDQPRTISNTAVSGTRTVLVIPVNYTNDTAQPATVEQLRSLVFSGANSVQSYYQQASNGHLRLGGRQNANGDVTEWRTIPFTNINCTAQVAQYAAAADNVALQQGFDPSSYQSVIYVFPSTSCRLGQSTIGSIGNQTQTNRVWVSVVNFDAIYTSLHQLFTHEFGHNLGLEHASAFRNCPPTLSFENCQGLDVYGDNADVMGNVSSFVAPASRLLNNYQRSRLGWLNGRAEIIDAPGTYYVRLSSPTSPTRATTLAQIRLKDPNGNFVGASLYLEARRDLPPYDVFDATELFDRGVAVRLGREDLANAGAQPFLIDTVPETGGAGLMDFRDAPLTSGRTFTNTYYGLSITADTGKLFRGPLVKIQMSR